jgi:predicted transcriptional regulator YdeE
MNNFTKSQGPKPMQKKLTHLSEIKLVGLKVRTNNQNEMNPATSRIGPCYGCYFGEQIASKIPHKTNPNTHYCAYTEYESDYKGDYTYFIGQEVTSFEGIGEGLETLTIPPQTYAQFTTDPGPMPQVVIQAWQEIWKMTPRDFGGKRSYLVDFEKYGEQAHDPQNAIANLYIGIHEGHL